MNKHIMLAAFCASTIGATAQFWNDTGNGSIIPGTNFIGTTNGVPIDFRTNNIRRMQLLPTLTGLTIGSYTNENLSGNLGIGAFTSGNVLQPFSLLHLDNGGTQFSGYRPWFRPGMTITNGSDLGWIGLKNEGGDINHLTLAWADNTAVQGPDLFKMIFLANPSTTGTAGTLDGLETMRILPLASGLESYFGIGDWFTAGANPSERLDVLDGRVRIRQLPDDAEADDKFKVMVVDASGDPGERGVVKWVDPSSLSGSAGCDWTLMNSGVSGSTVPHDVYTAEGSSNDCPDETDAVGIGTSSPKAKLHVFTKSPSVFGNDVILGHLITRAGSRQPKSPIHSGPCVQMT